MTSLALNALTLKFPDSKWMALMAQKVIKSGFVVSGVRDGGGAKPWIRKSVKPSSQPCSWDSAFMFHIVTRVSPFRSCQPEFDYWSCCSESKQEKTSVIVPRLDSCWWASLPDLPNCTWRPRTSKHPIQFPFSFSSLHFSSLLNMDSESLFNVKASIPGQKNSTFKS